MKKLPYFADSRTPALVGQALLGALALAACATRSGTCPEAPTAPGSAAAPANVIVDPKPNAAAGAAPAPGLVTVASPSAVEPPVVLKDVGFKTPESVLYDPEQDVYFVSNINGKPVEADGNGFISKVSPEGKVLELKWIDGTKKGSTLDAPKGLAVFGDTLYVADLNVIRLFDRKTGASKGKIAAVGSTFLNDVAAAPDGTIYVSDSGLKAGKEGLDPTGTDAVYKIGKSRRADKLIASKELSGPNGLLADDKGVWAVTFGTDALYRVGLDGKKEPNQKLPVGSLDGIVKLPDGSLLVSSWASSSVLRGTVGGPFETVIKDVKSPADIGYDTKRNVVLIPLFTLDSVQLQKLPGPAPVAAAGPAPVAPAAGAPAPATGSAPAPATPGAQKPAPATPAAPAPNAQKQAGAPAPAPMAKGKPTASFPVEATAKPAAVPPAAPAPVAKVPPAAPGAIATPGAPKK
jgi:sugar lactone lactonase YvrE